MRNEHAGGLRPPDEFMGRQRDRVHALGGVLRVHVDGNVGSGRCVVEDGVGPVSVQDPADGPRIRDQPRDVAGR